MSCFRKTRVYPILVENNGMDFNNTECMICLDETLNNKFLLPCGHCYHYNCILSWFEKKKSCPTCNEVFTWKKKVYSKNIKLSIK